LVTRNEALAQLTAPGEPFEIIEAPVIGRHVRVFRNAPATLRDIYAATRSGATFLVYEDERLTFEQVWQKSCALAAAFVEDFGVKVGDRVAISMRNYPEWIIAFEAATSIGAIAVAMNSLWQPHEMEFGLKNCGAKVLVADQERLDRLAAAPDAPRDVRIIAARTSKPLPAGAEAWDAVLARRPGLDTLPDVAFGPDDDAIMLYTSGSTGNPKGAVSTHRAVVHALLSWELDAQAAVLTGLVPAPDPQAPQTATLLGIPLFHVTGMHAVYLASYRYQRRLVSMYKWDAERAAELIEAERITSFAGPPAVTGDLVEVARRGDRDLSSLVTLGGGGAARAPEQVRAIDAVFPNARPGTGWGMTETNAIGTGIAAADYLTHPESSGRCSALYDLRVVTEDGHIQPTGGRGELQIRGVGMMREYWERPDANAEAFVDGDWFRTGDVAFFDADGFVYIVDRIKDLVIRGGENIGCGAVEAALVEHPAILEACVYGVPDERLGEEVGCTIYAIAPVNEAELQAFLAERLAKFQVPRYIHVEHEPLPRIATGKIAKRQLRAEHAERLKDEAAAEA